MKQGQKSSRARGVAPHFNKATERVLRVLDACAEAPLGAGVTALSRKLGMTKNMVFRALATLAGEGYVVRDARGTSYTLGPRLFELGGNVFAELDLRKVAGPYLRKMHELTGETVTLSIRVGDSSVVIDGVEGRHPVVARVLYGRPIPLHAGPGSRAILAFLPDSQIDAYIEANSPLRRITSTTIVDAKALRAEVGRVRRRGYAVGYGDHIPDAAALAFAILDASGFAQASIAIGAPDLKRGNRKLAPFSGALREIVAALNQRMKLFG